MIENDTPPPVAPVFAGHAKIVDRPRDQLKGLAVQLEAVGAYFQIWHADTPYADLMPFYYTV